MKTELAKVVGSGRRWLRVARLLAAIVILSGLAVSSAQAKDDTVIKTVDGSTIACSESGQYCLCSGGRNSEACKKVQGSCAPGSELGCEGIWCGCNVASGSPILSGATKIGGATKVPAGAEKLVDRFKRKN